MASGLDGRAPPPQNRLSQNMYINVPTLSQIAAAEAFTPESREELDKHVAKYAINRQIVLDTLESLGIKDGVINIQCFLYGHNNSSFMHCFLAMMFIYIQYLYNKTTVVT